MLAALSIGVGYVALIALYGWDGIIGIIAHGVILVVAVRWLKGGTRARLNGVGSEEEQRGCAMTTKHRAEQRVYYKPAVPLVPPASPPPETPPTPPPTPG